MSEIKLTQRGRKNALAWCEHKSLTQVNAQLERLEGMLVESLRDAYDHAYLDTLRDVIRERE